MQAKPKVNRIRVLQEHDRNERTFALTREIMTRWLPQARTIVTVPLDKGLVQFRIDNAFTDPTLEAVKIMIQTPGVLMLGVKKDQITVTKGQAWDWSEIQPAILSALRSQCFADAYEDVTVDDTTVPASQKR